MKRKIAHIITNLTLGGAQENTIYTFLNHDRSRYEVFLLTGYDCSFGGKNYLERLEGTGNIILVKGLSNSFNPLKDIAALVQIYIFLKKNEIDIAHTHSSMAGILGRIAAKSAGVHTIIHTVHGWSFHDRMSKGRRRLYVLLERMMARFSSKLITVSDLDAAKGLGERIGTPGLYVTIRSAIDFDRFRNYDCHFVNSLRDKYEGKRIIGTIGRLTEQKNILDFVRIAQKLLEKRNDLHFIIVGDGPQRKTVEKFIGNCGLQEHIILVGTRYDIQNFMHTFDVLVLTSLWEGLPRVIPEAMYCGVPVVANNVDGVAEIIENGVNGFATAPYDLDGSCHSIERLLDDIEYRGRIIKNAHGTVCLEYDAQIMVRKIEQLYEYILKEKNFI